MQRLRFAWMAGVALVAASAHAQQDGMIALPPNFQPQSVYSTKQEGAAADSVYSTKPAAAAPLPPQPSRGQPWNNQTLAPSPENIQMPPKTAPQQASGGFPQGYVPFGRASAEVTAPVPTGPRQTRAVPVENVGIVAEDLPPAVEQPPIALPPTDPTEPTAQTSPIFENDDAAGVRNVVLRGLNKVTARVETIEGPAGTVLSFGNLDIIAKSCRRSSKQSMTDYAALLEISERKADEGSKRLFSGWMYASSPSVMTLEHPVYDIMVIGCKAGTSDAG